MGDKALDYPKSRAQRDREADRLLAGLSVEQLRAGLAKGLAALAVLDAEEQINPSDEFDGPFPPSKGYENWSASEFEGRRHAYSMAINDTRAELSRRGVST
jgi:hypothetical protein